MHVRLAYFWPLITRCPISIIPDIGRVWVETDGFIEVLAWRKMVRSFKFNKLYAEDIATGILHSTRDMAKPYVGEKARVSVTYRRWFGLITVKAGDTW